MLFVILKTQASPTFTRRLKLKMRLLIQGVVFFFLSFASLFSLDTSIPPEKIFPQLFGLNSGPGSTLQATSEIRAQLPELLRSLNCKIFLDLPCGDCVWIRTINLPADLYIGGDCIKSLIDSHNKTLSSPYKRFIHVDACTDPLIKADVVLCRDMLVHLTFNQIFKVLNNLKKSESKYLLVTHFTNKRENRDISTGSWRPLNFTLAPFNFPEPLYIINEKYTGHNGIYSDKCLALWKIAYLPSIP